MASSKASTVEEYLAELPEDRRHVVAAVRELVLENLPDGYEEVMNWGMITYQVPLETYPDTYNSRPLMYIALAAQKRHYALYMTSVYQSEEKTQRLKDAYAAVGKKPDMGKSCLRFKKLDDLPQDLIAQIVAETPVSEFLANYDTARKEARGRK